MYLCLTTYLRPLEPSDPVLQRHWDYLDNCNRDGTLICSGPQYSGTGGALVIRATSTEDAEQIMRNDPLVLENRVTYELIGFKTTRGWRPHLVDSPPAPATTTR